MTCKICNGEKWVRGGKYGATRCECAEPGDPVPSGMLIAQGEFVAETMHPKTLYERQIFEDGKGAARLGQNIAVNPRVKGSTSWVLWNNGFKAERSKMAEEGWKEREEEPKGMPDVPKVVEQVGPHFCSFCLNDDGPRNKALVSRKGMALRFVCEDLKACKAGFLTGLALKELG